MTKRVTPLLDDPSAGSGVRELLQAGRDAQVTDYDYGSGLARHMAQVQAGAPMPEWAKGLEAGAGKGAAAAAAGTSLVGWWALPVATVAVAAAIGAVALFSHEDAPVPVARPHAATAVGAPAAVTPPVAAAPTAVPAAPVVAEPLARDSAQQRASAGRRESARASLRQSSSGGAKTVAAKHGQLAGARSGAAVAPAQTSRGNAASAENGSDLFADAPVATASSRATQSAAARSGGNASAPTAPAAKSEQASAQQAQPEARAVAASEERAEPKPEPVVDDTRLEREMGMLAVAQRVLHVDPARTLSLARQGEAEFAGSMFTQERQQLELLALVKLGRLDEAKRLARPYLARYPNGPFSDRVRRALSTGRVDR